MVGEPLQDRLKRLRLGLRLTQAALGQAAGITTQAVNQIERGRRTEIEPKTRAGLARALGVSETYLMTGLEALPKGETWPSIDSYLRATSDLTEEQISYIRRSLEAMRAERELAELQEEHARLIAEETAAYQPGNEADEQKRGTEDFEPR